MVRRIKRKWRRFYRTHREGCDLVVLVYLYLSLSCILSVFC